MPAKTPAAAVASPWQGGRPGLLDGREVALADESSLHQAVVLAGAETSARRLSGNGVPTGRIEYRTVMTVPGANALVRKLEHLEESGAVHCSHIFRTALVQGRDALFRFGSLGESLGSASVATVPATGTTGVQQQLPWPSSEDSSVTEQLRSRILSARSHAAYVLASAINRPSYVARLTCYYPLAQCLSHETFRRPQ